MDDIDIFTIHFLKANRHANKGSAERDCFSAQNELCRFKIAERIKTYYICMCMKNLFMIYISIVEGMSKQHSKAMPIILMIDINHRQMIDNGSHAAGIYCCHLLN